MSAQEALGDTATRESDEASIRVAAGKLDRAGYRVFAEHRWVPAFIFLVDVVAIEVCLYIGYLLRQTLSAWWPVSLPPSSYEGLIVGVLAVPIVFYLVGLHPGYGLGSIEQFRRRLTVTVSAFGLLLVWDYLAQSGLWSRGIILATFVVAVVLMPVVASLTRSFLIRKSLWGAPVLLVGTGEQGVMLARILRQEQRLGYRPIGFLQRKPHDHARQPREVAGLPVFGHVSDAARFKHLARMAIITSPESAPNGFGHMVRDLPFPRIIMFPELSQFPSLWVTSRDIGGILALELPQNLLLRRNRLIKQISDYVLTIPLFLISLPVLALAALCIKLTSPGPIFFAQVREGCGHRSFRMWKLRTMHRDAEERLEGYLAANPQYRWEWDNHMKLKHDPRIIPGVGRWLRKTSIDELPQLWDVLRGEMSLIGPRPFPHYHLEKFTAQSRELRAHVRPGITGLWQIMARSTADIEAQEELDMYYIRNWSLWLDLYILVRTIPAVLKQKGAQ